MCDSVFLVHNDLTSNEYTILLVGKLVYGQYLMHSINPYTTKFRCSSFWSMCFDFSIHSRTGLKDVLTPPAQPLPFQGKCRYISIISQSYWLRNHKLFLSFMQFTLHGVVKPLGLDSGEIKLSSGELGCTTDISRITISCTNWILKQRQKHNCAIITLPQLSMY